MKYRVTKTWGHDRGLSCAFRQHRATSHCRHLHGYALAFAVTFECEDLDERGWVIDFGSLSDIKDWLTGMFDHTTLVARDDPQVLTFISLKSFGVINLVEVEATGCEAFARLLFTRTNQWLHSIGQRQRVRIAQVDCMEHGSNKATVIPDYDDAH